MPLLSIRWHYEVDDDDDVLAVEWLMKRRASFLLSSLTLLAEITEWSRLDVEGLDAHTHARTHAHNLTRARSLALINASTNKPNLSLPMSTRPRRLILAACIYIYYPTPCKGCPGWVGLMKSLSHPRENYRRSLLSVAPEVRKNPFTAREGRRQHRTQ